MRIAVLALGKIGLPLAVQFADAGHDVVGVDVNARTVELVNAGTEPFPGETDLAEKLAATVAAGRLRATTDYAAAVPGADAVVLVVPLFHAPVVPARQAYSHCASVGRSKRRLPVLARRMPKKEVASTVFAAGHWLPSVVPRRLL